MKIIGFFSFNSFEIEGKRCTLEFTDSLQTVLLNGRPFKVEFGGLPKPIIVDGVKHFIRFSVLPRGFRPGYVKIKGMKGEEPKEPMAKVPTFVPTKEKEKTVSRVTPHMSLDMLPPIFDFDSTSQDGMDFLFSSKPAGKSINNTSYTMLPYHLIFMLTL